MAPQQMAHLLCNRIGLIVASSHIILDMKDNSELTIHVTVIGHHSHNLRGKSTQLELTELLNILSKLLTVRMISNTVPIEEGGFALFGG